MQPGVLPGSPPGHLLCSVSPSGASAFIYHGQLIYSACHSSVSLEEAPCQGPCQHTSCSSCLLLNPPPCPHTCTRSDSACLHRYGRCVHTHLAGLLNPVCHNDLQVRYDYSYDGDYYCVYYYYYHDCCYCLLFPPGRESLTDTFCAWSHRVRALRNDKFTLNCQPVHYKNCISQFECGVNLNKTFTFNKTDLSLCHFNFHEFILLATHIWTS